MIDYSKSWLTLEVTNNCNLKCPRCSQFNSSHYDKGFMDFNLFKKIIDEMVENKIRMSNINPFYRGEALLHPQFDEMLNYILETSKKHYPLFDFMVLHTNAELLTPKNTEAILHFCNQKILKHPGDIFFSIDAATKETYTKVRPGGHFEIVIENIKNFMLRRKQLNQYGPSAVFQFIVQEENRHEARLFYEYWNNFFKENDIQFSVDKSFGADIGKIEQTTIYFRRLQTLFEEQEKNAKMHLEVMEELGLTNKT